MPEFRTLSLTSALNEQLIAGEGEPASAVGIDGYVIPRAEWNDGVARLAKVPPFSFAAEGNDHLFCDGQTLPLSPGVRKLHFLGFSYWGDAFDEVAVRLSDGRTKNYRLVFSDWSHTAEEIASDTAPEVPENSLFPAFSVFTAEENRRELFFDRFTMTFAPEDQPQSARLPFNLFLEIFAVTEETGDE